MNTENVFLERLGVLAAVQLEQLVFQVADMALPGYKGGQWDFVKTESGAMYMRFNFEGQKKMQFGLNEGTLEADGAGISMTMIALSNLSFALHERNSPDTDKATELFYQLRDYALEHKESAAIFTLTD